MKPEQSCCFIGYLPESLPLKMNEKHPDYVKLTELLCQDIERLIMEERVQHFVSGMDIGIDQIAAKIVLKLKEKYPQITLESAIPYEEQAVDWTEDQRDEYFYIASQCDKETILQGAYTPDCFSKRNEYMVNHSMYVIAVWNGSSNITKYTVMCARRLNRHLTIINPETLQITREN